MATYRDTLNEIVKMNPEQQFSLAVSSSNKIYEYLESHGFNKNKL